MKPETLKLITLNAWGGRALHPLMSFLKHRAAKTDIFCFQEVFDADQRMLDKLHPGEYLHGDLFNKMVAALKDFDGTFARYEDKPNRLSLAMFIRKGLKVRSLTDTLVFTPDNPVENGSAVISSRKLQYATIETPSGDCTIANFHGLWVNGPKTDLPERIEQSKNIRAVLHAIPGPKVLCGDFNLLPDTDSIRILDHGMRNLVIETKVTSTRTPLYRHYANPAEPNFADYVIVSPDVDVHHFEVLPDLASDHAALLLEFATKV